MDLSQLTTLLNIVFVAAIAENMSLYYFLGTCPLISVSSELTTAFHMGITVTFVMLVSAAINYVIYYFILIPLNIEFLQLLFNHFAGKNLHFNIGNTVLNRCDIYFVDIFVDKGAVDHFFAGFRFGFFKHDFYLPNLLLIFLSRKQKLMELILKIIKLILLKKWLKTNLPLRKFYHVYLNS